MIEVDHVSKLLRRPARRGESDPPGWRKDRSACSSVRRDAASLRRCAVVGSSARPPLMKGRSSSTARMFATVDRGRAAP